METKISLCISVYINIFLLDINLLRVFLIGCKCDVNKTKNKLEAMYTGRTLFPVFFEDRDPLGVDIQGGRKCM